MPLDHANVTATISVTGLALGCYNPNTSNLEVAFIRHPRHSLKIAVTKQTAEGSAKLKFEVDSRHRIFIEAVKAIPPAEPRFTPGGFDRKQVGNDSEDLRWVVDLESELNNNEPVVLKQPEFPVTAMYVSKPVIYADPLNFVLDSAELVRLSDNTDVRPFGKFAEAGKADISCEDDGSVILRIEGPLGFSIELPHIAGATHAIDFKNLCQDPPGKSSEQPSDFTLYYSAVEDTAGDKFDLKVKNHNNGVGAVCNWVFLGQRESLSPLL